MALVDRVECWLVRHDATRPQIHKALTDCMQRGIGSLTVGGAFVADVAVALRGSNVDVGTVIGFPLGHGKSTVKAIEATAAAKDNAARVTVVPLGHSLLKPDLLATKNEMLEIVRAVRTVNPRLLVRLGLDLGRMLSEGEALGLTRLQEAARAARETGCDGIVAFGEVSGASLATLKRCGGGMTLIAHLTARDNRSAQSLLDAGADALALDAADLDALQLA